MKRANILRCGLLMTEVIWLTGCASTSKQAGVEQPEGQPSVVFDQPIAKTQQAAVDALAVIGCKIKKQEPTYVEGYRRNKMGLFVGSGGALNLPIPHAALVEFALGILNVLNRQGH